MSSVHSIAFYDILSNKKNDIFVTYFYSPSCRTCKMMSPFFEYLAIEYPNFSFAKINAVEADELSDKFNITMVPTVIAFKNNKELKRYTGDSNAEMEEFMEALKSSK
jgi:thioredoxin-like negative regulator of GroEL